MGDLIDRQGAIDAIDRERKKKHLFNTAEDGLLEARGVINTLPSAEPRKKGKWIEQDAGGDGVFYECSVCKDAFTLMDGTPSDNNYNFCPNCGSYNGGEEE